MAIKRDASEGPSRQPPSRHQRGDDEASSAFASLNSSSSSSSSSSPASSGSSSDRTTCLIRGLIRDGRLARDRYSKASGEVVCLEICLEATQAPLSASEGETSAVRAQLAEADTRVAAARGPPSIPPRGQALEVPSMSASSEKWIDGLQLTSLFCPPPQDVAQKKAQILAYVEYFGQFTGDSKQFPEDVAQLIQSCYPSKGKRLVDEVLVTFVLHHRKHGHAVVHPIVSRIIDGTLCY